MQANFAFLQKAKLACLRQGLLRKGNFILQIRPILASTSTATKTSIIKIQLLLYFYSFFNKNAY